MVETGQEVARLVDVCRQSIVFDGSAALTSCLAAIGNDPEVVLARPHPTHHPFSTCPCSIPKLELVRLIVLHLVHYTHPAQSYTN